MLSFTSLKVLGRQMRIIVNADDLGLSQEVSECIFALMARRRITSATILANAPFWEAAARQAAQFPWCSFGVHLNLTQFRPLTATPDLQPLLDETGRFSRNTFQSARFGAALRQAIFREWLSQIARVQAAGLRISHLDSHHDVHVQPQLFWTLKQLQRQTGLTKVRLAENLVPASQRPSRQNFFWNLAVKFIPPSRTTDGFGRFNTVFQASQKDLARFRTLELMVHPGHPDFGAETALLTTSWWEGLPLPVQLMNYHEL